MQYAVYEVFGIGVRKILNDWLAGYRGGGRGWKGEKGKGERGGGGTGKGGVGYRFFYLEW